MKVTRINKGQWGKLRAFFDIRTEEGFGIKGFKIVEGINGLFVGMPSQKGKDDEYFDTVYVAPEIREELNHVAIQTYGMQTDDSDNFEFPSKTTESPVVDNTTTESPVADNATTESPVADNATSVDETSAAPLEPAKAEESNTFSDDDIPF